MDGNRVNQTNIRTRNSFYFLLIVLMFCMAGCAHGSDSKLDAVPENRVYYDFTFDMRETPDVEILDYWLKTESSTYIFKNSDYYSSQGRCAQIDSNNSLHPRPTILYVKWLIKSTGEKYQDTVDVGKRLPKDMEDSALTFLIQGSHLNIYLATRELRSADWPIQGPRIHKANKVLWLYPEQPQPSK